MVQISKSDQEQLAKLQQISQSIEALIQQRVSMEAQIKDLELAIKELEDAAPDTVVYKSIGGLLIKSDRDKVLKDSKDKKETLELRLKSVQKQENLLKKQYEEIRSQLTSLFKK